MKCSVRKNTYELHERNVNKHNSSLYAFARILRISCLPSLPIHSTRHTHDDLQMEAGADMKYN